MDSPLKNPFVVGGLVLGGVCYALYTLVPADWLERLAGTAKPPRLPPPLNVVNPKSLSPDNRVFLARPASLPANLTAVLEKTEFRWDILPESEKTVKRKGPEPLPTEWKLTAIYLDEKSQPPVRAAVVSGDILKPGSKKGDFVVEEITADSVVFSHPSGKQTLTFKTDNQKKK